MTEQKALYQLIKENAEGGRLSNKFSLPSDERKEEIRFADGAMDGICMYHMAPYKLESSDVELMKKSVAAMSKGDYAETNAVLAQLGKNARAIQLVDHFQQYILNHEDEIDLEKAYPCIFDIVCKSTEKESIKFALVMMELLDTEHDFIKKVVRTIALSDEFTIFALWIMRFWQNGNNEIFEIAKNMSGWGKIHAVELLQPETEEIREWLLIEGTKNNVAYAYSALTCWEKSLAEERLKGDLTYLEYKGVLTLIDALLDEGPISGISNLNDADKIINNVILRSSEYELTAEDYNTIKSIKAQIDNSGAKEQYPLSIKACDTVISSE